MEGSLSFPCRSCLSFPETKSTVSREPEPSDQLDAPSINRKHCEGAMTPLLKPQLPRMAICDTLTDYCPSGTRLSTKDLDKRSVLVPLPLSSTHSLCRYSQHKSDLESVMALPKLRYPITDEHHMNGLILWNKIAEHRPISKYQERTYDK